MPVPASSRPAGAYAQSTLTCKPHSLSASAALAAGKPPYKTMSRDYEAHTLEAFYGFSRRALSTAALNPSIGASTTATALAKLKSSTRCTQPPRSTCATAYLAPETISPALAGREVWTII